MTVSSAAHLQSFQVMDVSKANKSAPLRNDRAAFPEAIHEAKSLLSEIERLCPDDAQQLGLKKDIICSVPFKLLHEPASHKCTIKATNSREINVVGCWPSSRFAPGMQLSLVEIEAS